MVSRLIIVALLTSTLSSCGLTSLIPTGGTNVAANTQLGAENNQNVGVTTYNKPEIKPEGPVDTVNQDNSTTNISELDPLLLILLVLGWLAPSPSEMGRGLLKLFRRKE